MKRILNLFLIALMIVGAFGAIHDFDNAKNWLETFKALFWLIAFAGALWSFVDDIHKDHWPWEVWK